MNKQQIAAIRLQNARAVMSENALTEIDFAFCLGKEPTFIEQALGNNPNRSINDNLARLIEQTFSKPSGWLDFPHEPNSAPVYDLFG